MDAQTTDGSGFDAALKALEDLETDVANAVDSAPSATIEIAVPPAAPAAVPIAAIEPIELDFAEIATEAGAAAAPLTAASQPPAPRPVEIAVAAVDAEPVGKGPEPEAPSPSPAVAIAPLAHTPEIAPAPVKPGKLPAIAVGLGLFSSILSAVGLAVASRTVVGASLVVADARERAAQLKQVGTLVHELEAIRAKQLVLLQRQEAAAAAAPLSAQDLDQRLGEFREGLIQRDQSKELAQLVHDGQSQLSDTMSAIGAKVSRIEAKLDAQH